MKAPSHAVSMTSLNAVAAGDCTDWLSARLILLQQLAALMSNHVGEVPFAEQFWRGVEHALDDAIAVTERLEEMVTSDESSEEGEVG